MKTKTKQILIFAILLCSGVAGIAQHVKLSNFYLISDNKQIYLFWTIESGPTCNGISIWHSTDSLIFEKIGDIPGVCGSSASATPYNFIDENPVLNTRNYYKIRMGYNQYSEIKSLFLNYIEPEKLIIKPNPANGNFTIEFNNSNNENYSLTIMSEAGKQVYYQKEIKGNNFILNSASFESGIYFIILKGGHTKALMGKLLIIK